MSLVHEFPNKGATVVWSNVDSHRNLLAIGIKDGGNAGFDDYGGELELHRIDVSSDDPVSLLGKTKTSARFSALAWSEMAIKQDDYGYGLIAGGMGDGSVNIWDPSKLISSPSNSNISSIQRHSGPINGLSFNPHQGSSHLLATGGADSAVYIVALDRPDHPNVFIPAPQNQSKHLAEVTKCAWNSQVGHILSTASADGICIIWDLRQKKPWCELRDKSRSPVTDIAWKPDEGLTFATASGDDNNPIIKLWDLRSSTTLPLATLLGHSQGILSMSWCPSDTRFLVSCAKDNSTLMWDVFDLKPVYELPAESGANSTHPGGNMFDAFSGATSRRYEVSWSPKLPAALATCSLDRKVQIFNMTAARTSSGRAPKWFGRRCGARFGFGGRIIRFGPGSAGKTAALISLLTFRESARLVELSRSFEAAVARGDFRSLCDERASAATGNERIMWRFMQVNFESNAREMLLHFLGFDADDISRSIAQFQAASSPRAGAAPHLTKEAANLVKAALLVGNFKAAVQCCLQANDMADALLLASCGGSELWAETQAEYFKRAAADRPFLNVVKAVIKADLHSYVQEADPRSWQETLAIIGTYAKSNEFPALCEALAKRLEEDSSAGRLPSNLCYMCAQNVEKTIEMWTEDLVRTRSTGGEDHAVALHKFVEKVSVYGQIQPSSTLSPAASALYASYAAMLAAEGEVQSALHYLTGSDESTAILRDRLYHSCKGTLGSQSVVPPFPFERVNVGVPSAQKTAEMYVRQVERMHQKVGVAQPNLVTPSISHCPLPPNWTELLDPTHNVPYYYNSITGDVQWERPASQSLKPKPVETSAASRYTENVVPSPISRAEQNQPVSTGSYGSVGGSAIPRPGNMSTVPVNPATPAIPTTQVRAPVPVTPVVDLPSKVEPAAPTTRSTPAVPQPEQIKLPSDPAALSTLAGSRGEDQKQVCASLQQITSSLGALSLNPPERKMLAEANKSVQTLVGRIAGGSVNPDVLDQISSLCRHVECREHGAAASLYKELVGRSWAEHKDWLKGFKHVTTLARKL